MQPKHEPRVFFSARCFRSCIKVRCVRQFDQSLNRTEKLHDPLTFPAQMYLDRYLEINKNVVTLKRAEIAQLRRTRRDLNRRLDQ